MRSCRSPINRPQGVNYAYTNVDLLRGPQVLGLLGASAAYCEDGWKTALPPPRGETISAAKFAQLRPGISTKTEVRSLLGAPWRILQFNDCGMAMPGQADESWDYRGRNGQGDLPRAHRV